MVNITGKRGYVIMDFKGKEKMETIREMVKDPSTV